MTKLQLDRNQWFEAKRHNEALEAEQARHNLETESISRESNQITRVANEEIARANRAREMLTSEAQAETARSNLAREAETLRHNSTNEKIDKYIAKTDNQREWQKLSLQEQRTTVQNALDLSTKNLREVETLVKSNEAKANIPQAERQKILASIEIEKRKVAEQQREFLISSQWKEKSLSIEERRARNESIQTGMNAVKTATSMAKDIVTTLMALSN